MEIDELYIKFKPLLLSISYRMLGSYSEAEDIVQSIFTDIQSLDITRVTNPKGYLCKMTTNRSIDFLKSAKKKREVYTGPWLPEPIIFNNQDDPLEAILQQDQISYAMLTLMEQLNPVERAVFVLREAFAFKYEEIASLIEKEESNCRKIFSRAKKKLSLEESDFQEHTQTEAAHQLISQFVHAVQTGNMKEMLRCLSKEAVLYSDGGGNVTAAIRPIVSSDRVLQFIQGLLKKYSHTLNIQQKNINGQLGLLIESTGEPPSIVCFDIKNEQIQQVFIIRNPEKLAHLSEV